MARHVGVVACLSVVVVRVVVVGVEIEVVEQVTDEVVQAFGRLLPRLSRSAPALDAAALGTVAQFPGNRLLVARVDGEIVGTLTLVTFPIPTGLRAWIEDVVVDEVGRGRGVGAALTQAAIRLAHAAGARTVDLTSRPSRSAANRLYERMGFKDRDSKVYRFVGSSPE
jgi:ribosomal protein S18 acetylase RimI-like enzyme